jgi:hypothetical protein
MCRSIKVLRIGQEMAGETEIEAAALQFVRKVSGFRKPSQKNQDPFDEAVREIAEVSRRLLATLIQEKAKAAPSEKTVLASHRKAAIAS